jgi:hypothetical protein
MEDRFLRVILAKLICRAFGWKFVSSDETGFEYYSLYNNCRDYEFIDWQHASQLDYVVKSLAE